MPVIWQSASLLLALLLEGAAAFLFFVQPESGLLSTAVLHLLASILATFAALPLVPATYRDQPVSRTAFCFALIFFIPLFGLAGVFLSLLPALRRPKTIREIQWEQVPIPELPFRPVRSSGRPSYGEGGLSAAMRLNRDPNQRVRAVIAARQVNDKLAVPLLQEALKDPVDDVRLFAYSVLDSKETHINDRIGEQLAELDNKQGQEKARAHYALAQNYWEMAFLGLATGSTFDFMLRSAEMHARLAAQLGWSGPDINFLVGRIQLRQQRFEEAEKSFQQAVEHGALESAILPFMAEIAFEKNDFNRVRDCLLRLDRYCEGHSPIPAVVQAWELS